MQTAKGFLCVQRPLVIPELASDSFLLEIITHAEGV
jgi:hypothetical protein